MLLGSLNLLILLYFMLFISIFVNISNSLHLLLTAELLWITLFALALSVGYIYDNFNVLSLTFFFLVLSAVEFGIGLILMLFQNSITKSIKLYNTDHNFPKFVSRLKSNLLNNKIKF